MFKKYASNLLQSISDECMLKSFTCKNDEDSEMYKKIAWKIDWVIHRIGVENSDGVRFRNNE